MSEIAIAGVGLALLAAGCGVEGIFECTQSVQCTARSGGICVTGEGCAYPDQACDSDLRFSEYSRRPGQCVPTDGTSTTDATTGPSTTAPGSESSISSSSEGSSESTGAPIPDCDGVDCAGHGECVMLDGAPACVCEPTYYRVGLQCLEDPCDARRCFFVDAQMGDDTNDGTRDAPWATLGRIAEQTYEPGDAVLLRRGRTWDAVLRPPSGPDGAEEPITVGAYGPAGDGPPTVPSIAVMGVSHVEIRDLRVEAGGVCVRIARSDHITLRDSEIRACTARAVRIDDDSHHTVVMSNVIEGMLESDAVGVIDADWKDPLLFVGDHHWIVDNALTVVPDPSNAAIQVDGVGITDIKVVGNRVSSMGGFGIRVTDDVSAWVVGNTVALAGDEVYRACIELTAMEHALVSGNVVFECLTALRIADGATATIEGNTLLHAGTGPALLLEAFTDLVFRDNLVVTAGLLFRLPAAELPDVEAFDANWYGDAESECIVNADGSTPWADWVAASGLDVASTCAPSPVDIAGVDGTDPSTWSGAFVPDPRWTRCDEPAGAFACDGARIGTALRPIAGFDDNDGKGWEGPIEVRLRWPIAE